MRTNPTNILKNKYEPFSEDQILPYFWRKKIWLIFTRPIPTNISINNSVYFSEDQIWPIFPKISFSNFLKRKFNQYSKKEICLFFPWKLIWTGKTQFFSHSSSSSCCATSTDILDPLSPPISIVPCSREVFKAISCIGTELLYVGSCWSFCVCSSVWSGLREYVAYKFVLTSAAVSHMSGSSN